MQATYLPQADLLRITAKEARLKTYLLPWGQAQQYGDGNNSNIEHSPFAQVAALSGRSGTKAIDSATVFNASFAKTPSRAVYY